tara:strand:+ start:1089 stop:1367 length:279 start_codon:yes stop_codon:yes gene_type:complete
MTKNKLQHAINELNNALGNYLECYQPRKSNKEPVKANGGTYYYCGASGGYRLEQMCEGGGARDISNRGTKREVFDYVQAMLKGISATKDLSK